MINSFKDKKVAVLGLGMEGKDLVNFLINKRADVTVYDQKNQQELDFGGVDKRKIKIVCGPDYLANGLVGFDIIYRSPGVYRHLPELNRAKKNKVQISSATRLFFDLCPGKIIGVTGTKGKGTTSTIIYQILKNSGEKVYLAGNIGKPYLELLPKLTKKSWVVLELSSFQLIDLDKSPQISVVLNITVDHLDWHKSIKEYVDAKSNIVKYQTKEDFAVVNFDYSKVKNLERFARGKIFYFSRRHKVKGCYIKDGKIILAINRREIFIGDTNKLLLRGEHNWENITAAVCASRIAGGKIDAIKKTIFNFRGLEHRLELVGKIKGVDFYNDSFATNPQPTIAAINSFTEPLVLIAGGSEKGLNYTELGEIIAQRKNIKGIVLIGQIALKIEKSLKRAKFKGELKKRAKSMREAVNQAISLTQPGDVVLLSPASASFDMFKDYEDRGDRFKKAVKSLKLNTS